MLPQPRSSDRASHWLVIVLVIPWAITYALLGNSAPTTAVPANSPAIQAFTLHNFTPTDPKNPKSGAGGGTRPSSSTCLQSSATADSHLIALSPPQAVGQTLQARPDFWIYLPPTVANQVELSLSDQGEHEQQILLPLPQRTGWVKLPFPANFTSLVIHKTYTWSVALVCNPQDRPQDWVVSGTVRYIPSTPLLQQTLQTASHDLLPLMVRANFLLDAMSQLEQRTPASEQLEQAWQHLIDPPSMDSPSIKQPSSVRHSTHFR
ncbi:MAG: DUF928 domain-containing protein [Synechococcales bacterium]|nr:DUF928 domain-containing protein [Synechococcales bacterium]